MSKIIKFPGVNKQTEDTDNSNQGAKNHFEDITLTINGIEVDWEMNFVNALENLVDIDTLTNNDKFKDVLDDLYIYGQDNPESIPFLIKSIERLIKTVDKEQ